MQNELPPSVGSMFLVENYEVKNLEGKLLTIVESVGLPERQEEAVKGLMRQTLWNMINSPTRSFFWEGEYQQLFDFLRGIEEGRNGTATTKVVGRRKVNFGK